MVHTISEQAATSAEAETERKSSKEVHANKDKDNVRNKQVFLQNSNERLDNQSNPFIYLINLYHQGMATLKDQGRRMFMLDGSIL